MRRLCGPVSLLASCDKTEGAKVCISGFVSHRLPESRSGSMNDLADVFGPQTVQLGDALRRGRVTTGPLQFDVEEDGDVAMTVGLL